MKTVSLAIGIHNHQPVGNFDHVIEQAYQNAYLPFLLEMEKHPSIPFAIHNSGCLLDWIEINHSEMIETIRTMVERGQVEIVGGGYYEPIVTIIPECDRIGQIQLFTKHLEKLFNTQVKGVWLAERVWEQFITKSLAEAGISYTMLDDTHFRNAGVVGERLFGYYTTEDSGKTVAVFPMSEKLRYLIPFRNPQETIDYLRELATEDGRNLVVYADDGEKFGVWPGTHKHCYSNGWLPKFLNLLEENRDWLKIVLFRDAMEKFNLGRVYFPDSSYREMGEWVYPPDAKEYYDLAVQVLKERGVYEKTGFAVRGGTWRNFRTKYPEANCLYAKMLEVSQTVEKSSGRLKDKATQHLYKGQCNCAYWHGIFGGLYLPHLRTAVYENLIAAENIVKPIKGVVVEERDFDCDGMQEFCLRNEELNAYLDFADGATLYELDVKRNNFNLLNTLARREESYHREIRNLLNQQKNTSIKEGEIPSIHEIPTAGNNLGEIITYDRYNRCCFIHHFFKPDTSLNELVQCKYEEAQFVNCKPPRLNVTKENKKGQKSATVSVTFLGDIHQPWIGVEPVFTELEKSISLLEKDETLVFTATVSNTGAVRLDALFALEFNLALLSDRDPEKCYQFDDKEAPFPLSTTDLFAEKSSVKINDNRLGLKVGFDLSAPAGVVVYPVYTVNHSEKGFEKVYQCSCIIFLWNLSLMPGEELVRNVRFYARAC